MKRIFHVAAAVIAWAAVQCGLAAEPVGLPARSDVISIAIGDDAMFLDRTDDGWTVRQLAGAPIHSAKIERFLAALLMGMYSPVPAGIDPALTGLGGDEGLRVTLTIRSGGATTFSIGLRPEGNFDAVYVRTPDGAVNLLAVDLRGMLGLWINRPGETPEPAVWFTDGVGFDHDAVVGLTATYPDHVISLTRVPGSDDWTLAQPAPGGELSQDGVYRWLRDLSDFKFTGVGAADSEESWTHSIVLSFEDGSELTIRAQPDHAGGHALATLTTWPVVFMLPQWRFTYYFNRIDSLFPDAVPHFALSDVRLVDVRRDGESVKITRRDDGWEAVALPYAVKAERVEQLARLLVNWRPEDYADADPDARPGLGGTTTEVVLAGGGVHQYRLGGRHPVFPWRSVVLDGKQVFSVNSAEAEVMFPGFADILEIAPEPEPVPEPEPTPAPEPEPGPLAPLVEVPAEAPAVAPAEAPARKIVPSEVDFSGSVAEKAALSAPASVAAPAP